MHSVSNHLGEDKYDCHRGDIVEEVCLEIVV